MKEQSRRATQLTLLAAFYLPLTLVTGIFGMNIKEFEDAKPPFRHCYEALFAVIAVTLVVYVASRIWSGILRKPILRRCRNLAKRLKSVSYRSPLPYEASVYFRRIADKITDEIDREDEKSRPEGAKVYKVA